jgi:hypothetical protein
VVTGHPDTTTEAVSSLGDEDEARNVDDLEKTPELEFQQPNLLDEALEIGATGGTGQGNPIHSRVVGKVEHGCVSCRVDLARLLHPKEGLFESGQLLPDGWKMVYSWLPFPPPHL